MSVDAGSGPYSRKKVRQFGLAGASASADRAASGNMDSETMAGGCAVGEGGNGKAWLLVWEFI